jgi:hypothetical protein
VIGVEGKRMRVRMGKNVRAGRDARRGEARKVIGDMAMASAGRVRGAGARSNGSVGADKVSGAPANRRALGNLSLDKVSNPQLLFSEHLLRPL